jgi:serine/threonine protein kinase
MLWTIYAAITRRNLFLVMEYLPGGDFMSLLECIVQLEEQVRL